MIAGLQILSSGFMRQFFWPPARTIFRLKIVRETTTYWGWLQPSKSYDFVPYKQTWKNQSDWIYQLHYGNFKISNTSHSSRSNKAGQKWFCPDIWKLNISLDFLHGHICVFLRNRNDVNGLADSLKNTSGNATQESVFNNISSMHPEDQDVGFQLISSFENFLDRISNHSAEFTA